MLIGRQNELSILNQLYRRDTFACVMLHGRRRIGKTSLMQEFCKNKKTIYFAASETTLKNNLLYLTERMTPLIANEETPPAFESLAAFLGYLCSHTAQERYVLIIDDFHVLADCDRSVLTDLGSYLNGPLNETKCFLMITGSSATWLNRHVFNEKSPLAGGITASVPLAGLDYYDSARFLPGFSATEKAILYGVTGGVPAYLEAVDPSKTIKENIISLFFNPGSFLLDEPLFLLKQELREPGLYNAILEAVAMGGTRLNEIAGIVRLETSACATYMRPLINLMLLDRVTPLAGETARKTCYSIRDSLFTFWYRYVLRNRSAILAGEGATLFETQVWSDIPVYMHVVFEQMAGQYLLRKNKRNELPFTFNELGWWWDIDPSDRFLAAVNRDTDDFILSKCRFTNGHIGMEAVNNIYTASKSIKDFSNIKYAMFSKSGFTRQVLGIEDLMLIDMNSLYI